MMKKDFQILLHLLFEVGMVNYLLKFSCRMIGLLEQALNKLRKQRVISGTISGLARAF
ncbi:hypothetical protein SAMN05444955_102256 [Lihuaxuella thermophila]|uniref:Uncharacterized protein n=1 Tax=Lihuaxuella thermophila TaxID=1173111 RepID=A0A1H8BLY5_9BACL|nr:hypothetical protein SAMN05444955_102256 [Lihuaxuella thermophila]